MQCPHCRHDNRDGARFCGECGRSLQGDLACPRCATVNPPGQKFCDSCGESLSPKTDQPSTTHDARVYTPPHLAEKILTSRSALEGERKHVSVLFVDVVDSMRLAEMLDAEEWHRTLDRVFEILTMSVHRFEGTINQFTGDGVMALFGAPVAHEDHARRACHAALHAIAELRAYADVLRARGLELSVRMGLNSGEVVVGKIGDDLRMDYTAQGHCVGLAARMQQLAAPGTVLLTEHIAHLVEGFFALADVGVHEIKGVSGPVRVFELQGIGPLRARLDASALRGLSRLIGRKDELTWLAGILARATESNGQVVGVVGEAGVGKSRLCLEFIQRCREGGVTVYEVHCPAHGSTVSWLAVRDLLRAYFALADGQSVDAIRQSVAGQLRALEPGFEAAVPLVLEALGITEGAVPDASVPSLSARLGGFMRRLVRLRSANEPVVVLLDDAHWIDRESDQLVREIAASVRDTRTLLLLNFRPEYQPPWMKGSHYQQLALSPLGAAASRELLQELLGSDRSLGQLWERIHERTAGNPFFTEEVVQALALSGSLSGERGAYRLTAPIESLALPATVHALLAARIDRLDEQTKRVLQAGAVIGKQFDQPLLRAIAGLDDRELGAALDELQAGEFVRLMRRSSRDEYAFKHPLLRDVAYHSQLTERRARLHAAAATALEKLHADRLAEYASLIAHHWEASGMRFEAARWKRRAALKVANIKVKGRRRRPMP